MFVNLETLEVINRDELQAEFPRTSFPPEIIAENLLDLGYGLLEYDPAPDLGPGESLAAGDVRLDGDRVVRGWTIVPPTEVQLKSIFEQAVQGKLDSAAQGRGYDSVSTAISYAEEPAVPKFQNDGKAFRAWRSLVWAYAYEQLDLVLTGKRARPTVHEFLLELPAVELPK